MALSGGFIYNQQYPPFYFPKKGAVLMHKLLFLASCIPCFLRHLHTASTYEFNCLISVGSSHPVFPFGAGWFSVSNTFYSDSAPYCFGLPSPVLSYNPNRPSFKYRILHLLTVSSSAPGLLPASLATLPPLSLSFFCYLVCNLIIRGGVPTFLYPLFYLLFKGLFPNLFAYLFFVLSTYKVSKTELNPGLSTPYKNSSSAKLAIINQGFCC